jgi:hypothetical protein
MQQKATAAIPVNSLISSLREIIFPDDIGSAVTGRLFSLQ